MKAEATASAIMAKKIAFTRSRELWSMNADGTNVRQVTRLGAGSFAPFFHPDGKRILGVFRHGAEVSLGALGIEVGLGVLGVLDEPVEGGNDAVARFGIHGGENDSFLRRVKTQPGTARRFPCASGNVV